MVRIANVLILSILLLGCSKQEEVSKPASARVKVVEKSVVVTCEIPEIDCDFSGKGFEPTKKLLECVKLQKEALRICSEAKVK